MPDSIARWRVVVATIAAAIGGVSDCCRTGTIVRFDVAPVPGSSEETTPPPGSGERASGPDSEPGRSTTIRLTEVLAAWIDPRGVAFATAGRGPGLDTMAAAWSELCSAVTDLVPGPRRTGLVLDFGHLVLGCWPDQACGCRSEDSPGLVIDLSAEVPIENHGSLIVAGVDALASSHPVPPCDGAELSERLMSHLDQLGLTAPGMPVSGSGCEACR